MVHVDNERMMYIQPGHAVIAYGRYGKGGEGLYAISFHASPKLREIGASVKMSDEEVNACEHLFGLVFESAEHMRGYVDSLNNLYDIALEDEKTNGMQHPLSYDYVANEIDGRGKPIWVEFFKGELVPMVITNESHQYGDQIIDGRVYKLADYGRTWRIWKDEPTQEERDAHQWWSKSP